ncbi:hypothetical protein HER10_EVM0012482 [Colletotrichum scovillei]|uniref:Peptide synthetase n=1 Tax=Colletotrichum scovillei TaxID=1209932 RepID=A0A9P7QWD4_9PEZI|nr:uncharacterized protein HER10_EVM0012482 [Colletotrichum scovillei]KAF4778930.1 hypothetical protein HER10_EVM0012482 [Colletotrichum scovillei]KAG7043859.1 Peptide synthetase [Colletotrichum scovillei]KAG7045962.1 Peptide synthetase [Colletotrichum scovillei]KAG7063308.1 Peptide synthetase [Colletotrichum scovillei]
MQPKAAMPVSQIRPAIRHRGLIVVTAAVTAVAVSFRYTALFRRTNDQNQCSSNPYYVSVDRSGGGI